ncbi:glycosyltransferase family 4 protein [Streptococcus suis]|uniref:Glycosyltransferase n=1 Tax=Streptococcus suis TaxID=1307 RepID=A0A1P8VRW6_STRSU|nr:Glycosyltransferase [Streptococcus suis]MCK4019632.1 glycosyltransferase family 4 protein [Streptococcus suis]HEL2460692.1 glycosyltransferase family 4 protein [Streptococcus suis]HEM6011614.1 glycosyltransferase family 4 protein [Streptococcus suis]HEM6041491.1 glycosyltransferase family 4 protein [Streptococcus suis]
MKLKILMYVNSLNYYGGIERVIANLSNALSEDYQITILVKDSPVSVYRLNKTISIHSINEKLELNMNSKLHRILNVPYNMIRSIIGLKKYFKSNDFDYVYTAFPINGLEVYLASKKYRKRLVASEHASYYAYNSIYKKIKEYLYPKLAFISVPTKMDTEIYKKLGYNAIYIPHLTTYDKIENNSLLEKTIINVGRLTSDKQQMMLLEIWQIVNKKIPNNEWKLQIIGSGEEEDNLQSFISSSDIKNVEMVPHTSRIADYYSASSLFVFTSRTEGFGMVLLEAMSFGLPCISFDCPSGPRDIIDDGKNGFLISCYDKELFAEKICQYIMSNSDEKQKLGQGATRKVENWDNRAILEQWKDIFK